MALLCSDFILGSDFFQTTNYKFCVRELYNLNTIVMKKNWT